MADILTTYDPNYNLDLKSKLGLGPLVTAKLRLQAYTRIMFLRIHRPKDVQLASVCGRLL